MERISDQALAEKVEAAVRAETLATLQVLKHLQEVERRELHLSLGYSSLWDYATKKLRYSESAAYRRIATARAISRFPELEGLFIARKVNLATVSLVSSLMTNENKVEVVSAISGKSKREVAGFVESWKPVSKVRESVREVVLSPPRQKGPKQVLLSPVAASPAASSLSPDTSRASMQLLSPMLAVEAAIDGGAPLSPATAPLLSPAPTKVFKAQVVFSEVAMAKLNTAKDRLSHRTESLADVIEVLCDYYLQREGSVRARKVPAKPTFPASRYIPKSMKVEVRKRDGDRCTFVGTDGRRCECTSHLQFDHVVLLAHGGRTEVSNLRLLCSNHNKHAAKVVLGKEAVEAAVLKRRMRRAVRGGNS